ncbi:kinesin-like protein KIF23 [Linepithema humile]|uniref:kinesin-like protein KIF23 n=1 Tax=Linepithema humile TaxID=83485 RepID=UPI00351DFDD1
MKPARSKTPAREPINQLKGSNVISKDPVQVYCRLRPMHSPSDVSCMKVVNDTKVIISSPESAINFRTMTNKEIHTTFSRVFTHDIKQREIFKVVAFPLVENLIHRRNGLLFTYGVTGSGKTYTMTGKPQDAGIIPRCLDVIFNTIASYQTKKFVFKPNKLNGFDVQSKGDVMERNELYPNIQRIGRLGKLRKVDSDGDPIVNHGCNESLTILVKPDHVYSVFITYVEIYNNNVYDLLDEEDIRSKTLQVREDGNKNMYVHAVTEVEVRSAEEAFELFQRGQRKRRIGHTALNPESSRSHSIFTIRLVQAPLDSKGEYVTQDKQDLCISQLSLVDLAGSERTNRTKNTGQRLQEAGKINNSLMTLRSCLEILRENQSQGTNKMVPYRESKLTLLFKNYFDGEGQVRVIVCANPRADDYDETIQVMKFAEITQEVQTPMRSNAIKLDLGFTPGRRQPNKLFKEARSKFEREGRPEVANLDIDLGLVYSLSGPFPQLKNITPDSNQIHTLMQFLEQRISKRDIIREQIQKKEDEFRKRLVMMEKEIIHLKTESATVKAAYSQEKEKNFQLNRRINDVEGQNNKISFDLNTAEEMIRDLKQKLRNRNLALNQRSIDVQKAKQKYNTKIQAETDKMNKELDLKERQMREQFNNQMKGKDERLRLIKQILEDNGIKTNAISSKDQIAESAKIISLDKNSRISRKDRLPVSNPRYRRSQSADRWIDHRPETLVPIGTVLQPRMQRRRSITRLTSPKEITEGASRYALIAQEHDTDGELETKIYKADILPTSGGGAQVVFNDMECLKQTSPKARKRTGPWEEKDVDEVNVSSETKRLRV